MEKNCHILDVDVSRVDLMQKLTIKNSKFTNKCQDAEIKHHNNEHHFIKKN